MTLRPPGDLHKPQLGWRMAVLPFRTEGASVGLGIALGMAEEISAVLARYRTPRLIATATFWDGLGPAHDVHARCKAYHLDYIIEGVIHVQGDTVHVEVTLSDVVLDFEAVWRGHFNGQLSDLFSLQYKIAYDMITQVDPELFHDGSASEPLVKTEVAGAHQSVLKAIQAIHRLDKSTFMRARDFLNQAIDLDPDYAEPHAWMAYWSILALGLGWPESLPEVVRLAGGSAERAVQLDPFNARALAVAGHVRAYMFHDVHGALDMHARAIELNPNLPIAWNMSGWSRIYNGEHTVAVRHLMMAQSLSPRDPHTWFVEHALMAAQFFNRNLEEAAILADFVLEQHPDHVSALNMGLAIMGHLRRTEDASRCLRRLQSLDPSVTVTRIASRAPFRPDDKSFYMEGLELAGVPK